MLHLELWVTGRTCAQTAAGTPQFSNAILAWRNLSAATDRCARTTKPQHSFASKRTGASTACAKSSAPDQGELDQATILDSLGCAYLDESGAGTFERRSCAGSHCRCGVDLLIFSRRYRGGPGKATNCPPRRPYRERLRSSLSTLRGRGRAQAAIPRRAPDAAHRPAWPRALPPRRPLQREVNLR